MSTIIMAACWPLQLSAKAKAVLISLADNANDTGYCWPSIEFIATRTCLHRASVMRAIVELEAAGLVNANRANGRHTTYTVHPDGKPKDENQSHTATGCSVQPVAHSKKNTPNQSHTATAPVAQCDTNRQEPSKRKATVKATPPKKSAAAVLPPRPGWIDPEAWDGFVDMRKRERHPLTERAATLIFHKLDKLRVTGQNPSAVLDQSTANGWRDVYPLRENGNENHQAGRKLSTVERVEQNILKRRAREAEAASTGAAPVRGDP